MAELLRAKLTNYKQVINIEDVHQIITVLGTPEDISIPRDQLCVINSLRPVITGCTAIPTIELLAGSVQE